MNEFQLCYGGRVSRSADDERLNIEQICRDLGISTDQFEKIVLVERENKAFGHNLLSSMVANVSIVH